MTSPKVLAYTVDDDLVYLTSCEPAIWDADPLCDDTEALEAVCGPTSPRPNPTIPPINISGMSVAQLGTNFHQEAFFDTLLSHNDPQLLQESFNAFLTHRQGLEQAHVQERRSQVAAVFTHLGLVPPLQPPTLVNYGFNQSLQQSYSQFLRGRHGSLSDLIKLHRGETVDDPRPNKALCIPEADFPRKDLWRQVVTGGVVPKFHTPLPLQSQPPKNHQSWAQAWPLVIADIAKGQLKDEYLILDGDLLPWLMESQQVFISPFGAAEKQGKPITECARIVHDESFPRHGGISINSATDKLPCDLKYDGVKAIASWALRCHDRYPGQVVMMTGDVAGAFRNVPISAAFCGLFSGFIPELNIIVVNLCLPFGWTDAPAYYWLAGLAIKTLHNSRRGFKNLTYCDDHILMGRLGSLRLSAAAIALRRSMVLVLGTKACNNEKFTDWACSTKALGLMFDLSTMTVSMPADKISKVVGRLSKILSAGTVKLKSVRETLGLLRYLGMCVPVAKPFFNRLQGFQTVLENVTMPLKLPEGPRQDTRWLLALFRSNAFQEISLRRLAGVIDPHESIHMDASDWGVCAVWHAKKLFLAVPWNTEEKKRIQEFKNKDDMSFSINYRELLGAYFAMVTWARMWSQTYGKECHVRFVIDNTSAVAWSDTRNTKHPAAQAALRLMGLIEAGLHIMTSSEHIPGEFNVWPDLGSRMWSSERALLDFKLMSIDYVQVEVRNKWRCPCKAWSEFTRVEPSVETVMSLMDDIGFNGLTGAN